MPLIILSYRIIMGACLNQKQSKLEKETHFSKEKLDKLYKKFIKDHPDGHISKKEFRTEYKRSFPDGDVQSFTDRVFQTFDTNNDGYIDYLEFVIALNLTTHGSYEEKLRWAFSVYDHDNDQRITGAEVDDFFLAYEKMVSFSKSRSYETSRRQSQVFSHIMRDYPDGVTFEEFMCIVNEHPNFVDSLPIFHK